MKQQKRPERACQHQWAELEARRTERQHGHGQENRKHRLLPADNGARQKVQRPERCDRTEFGQEVNAEHVIAGGAEGNIGEPECQWGSEIGADLILAAKGYHGGEFAGRAAVQKHGHEQPQRRLQQHYKPDDQPRPGADQFDDQGGETHEGAGPAFATS
jgi:hypothetical protein